MAGWPALSDFERVARSSRCFTLEASPMTRLDRALEHIDVPHAFIQAAAAGGAGAGAADGKALLSTPFSPALILGGKRKHVS